MRIQAFPISFPPRRFIGSELMTAALLRALADAGHRVRVMVGDGAGDWAWHGIPVSGNALTTMRAADVAVVHAGRSWPGVEYRHLTGARLVMICHNTSEAVRDDVAGARPDLVVVNSESMRDELDVDALVVNPPAPPVTSLPGGDRIVTLSLNAMKGGPQFLRVARRLPDREFLAVQSGYGKQMRAVDGNVEVLEHVPHEELAERVWSRAGVFLQLSSSESWGMAAAEAIAHGVPVVAHPTPGLRENLGDAAVWVDRDDIGGIVRAVEAVRSDPRRRSVAVARARAAVATSAGQVAGWVAAIEGLGHGASDQRDGAARGVLAGR